MNKITTLSNNDRRKMDFGSFDGGDGEYSGVVLVEIYEIFAIQDTLCLWNITF